MDKKIPVVKIKEFGDTDRILSALENARFHSIEITFRTDCAYEAIKYASKHYPNLEIGAGTVINKEQAEKAVEAGAKFLVSPGFSKDVSDVAKKNKIQYIPGCVTPTEIMAALEEGITLVKFFPAEQFGGLKTIKALSGPFPQVRFMATGGINEKNIDEYLSSPLIVAVGASYFVEDALKNVE
ncbi:MAG: bifunctional 4-hydroxy-2-oxoglutarate aldolase/2-dehydro-3-deoxy-phosphogluconate aldolase [Bacilli bacterium]|nr:bifunctional 4-hydroxy-2-oxoglutarate aldolase/2-dehydro-3-deoxy-phosphogluconate aldolase [Bacilli bacterium]